MYSLTFSRFIGSHLGNYPGMRDQADCVLCVSGHDGAAYFALCFGRGVAVAYGVVWKKADEPLTPPLDGAPTAE